MVSKMISNLRLLLRKEVQMTKKRRRDRIAIVTLMIEAMMKMKRMKKKRLSRPKNQSQFQNLQRRKSKLLLKLRRHKQSSRSKMSMLNNPQSRPEVRKEKVQLLIKMKQICKSSGRKLPRSSSNSLNKPRERSKSKLSRIE